MLKKTLIVAAAITTIFSLSACQSQRVSYKRATTEPIQTICVRENPRKTGMDILEPLIVEAIQELGYKSELVNRNFSDANKCPHILSYSAKANRTTHKKVNLKISQWWPSTEQYESLGGISYKKRINVKENPSVAKAELKTRLTTLLQQISK